MELVLLNRGVGGGEDSESQCLPRHFQTNHHYNDRYDIYNTLYAMLYTSDIVVYNKKYILGLCLFPGRAPETLQISLVMTEIKVSPVNEVTFGKFLPPRDWGAGCQKNRPLIRGLRLSVSPTPPSPLRSGGQLETDFNLQRPRIESIVPV